jgi:hypothetical protein
MDFGSKPLPHLDGGVDRFGRNRPPIWTKLYGHIARLGANPLDFIRAQFVGGRRPGIRELLAPVAAIRWQEQVSGHAAQRLAVRISNEFSSFRTAAMTMMLANGWSEARAVCYALTDTTTCRASSLLRFCLARRAGLLDIATHYQAAAEVELLLEFSEVAQVLGELLPADLHNKVATEMSSFAQHGV